MSSSPKTPTSPTTSPTSKATTTNADTKKPSSLTSSSTTATTSSKKSPSPTKTTAGAATKSSSKPPVARSPSSPQPPPQQSEDSESHDEHPQPLPNNKPLMAVKYNTARRGSVSAESYQPGKENEPKQKVVIPKSDEAKMRIAAATSHNLLFRNLEGDQRKEVVDAMFEKKVTAGDTVIRQGDEGDNFYVVDEGTFEVFVNDKKVVEIGSGGSFGELALMYNTPRAATVKAVTNGTLWAVDRATFRRSITDNMYRKRKMYETFLKTVPLFAGLSPVEVSKIADSLEPVEYDDADTIIEQGEQGDNFFIMVEGEAVVSKLEEEGGDSVDLMTLKQGDFFGELALITDKPRAATVTAKGPVKCACLNTQAFIRLLGPCMDILKRHTAVYEKYEPLLQ